MIGSWSIERGDFVSLFLAFLFLFFVLLFVGVVVYWFNRLHRVPSLKLVGKTMLLSLRTFPPVLTHRVRSVPGRIRHRWDARNEKPSPYPPSPSISKAKRVKKKKK
ncbi:MAG: hypothetical protein AABW68_04485 [archaeon]